MARRRNVATPGVSPGGVGKRQRASMDGRVREPGRSEGCAASRGRVSPAQPGWTRKEVHGSTAYPTWKHGRDRSMPLTRCSSEDAWGEAPQDPHDMVKVTLPKFQSPLGVFLHPPVARLQPAPRCALIWRLDGSTCLLYTSDAADEEDSVD